MTTFLTGKSWSSIGQSVHRNRKSFIGHIVRQPGDSRCCLGCYPWGKKTVTVADYEPQKMCEKKSTIVTVTKTQFVTGTETQSRQLCDVSRPTTHEEKNRSLQESKKENLAV